MTEPEFRFEIKYTTAATALPEVLAAVRTHPAGFRTAYETRQVNSLYFDTADWEDLSLNLAGVAHRAKLRLRWYGADLGTCRGRLEVKEKRGELGRKLTARLGDPLLLRGRPWSVITAELRRRDLGALAPRCARHDRPTLLGRYDRRYFVSADGCARLTVDTGIRAFDQAGRHEPNLTRARPAEDLLVVELKGDADRQRYLAEVATRLPLRRGAHSKYVHGLVARAA